MSIVIAESDLWGDHWSTMEKAAAFLCVPFNRNFFHIGGGALGSVLGLPGDCTGTKELSFSEVQLNDNGVRTLSYLLPENTTCSQIETLRLDGKCSFGEEGIESLATSLTAHGALPQLKTLRLNKFAVCSSDSETKLGLSKISLTPADTSIVAHLLSKGVLPKLASVDLSQNSTLGDGAITPLCDIAGAGLTSYIDMTDIGMSPAGHLALGRILLSSTETKLAHVSCDSFATSGVSLDLSRSVEPTNLRAKSLTYQDMALLAGVLKANTTMVALKLQSVRIDANGVEYLAVRQQVSIP